MTIIMIMIMAMIMIMIMIMVMIMIMTMIMMTGNTAYFGFLELCAPRPGETGNNTISGMIILHPGRQSWSAAPRGPWAASWARSPRSRQEIFVKRRKNA